MRTFTPTHVYLISSKRWVWDRVYKRMKRAPSIIISDVQYVRKAELYAVYVRMPDGTEVKVHRNQLKPIGRAA